MEGACSGSCRHSLTATVCGRLSCSCEDVVLVGEQTGLSVWTIQHALQPLKHCSVNLQE